MQLDLFQQDREKQRILGYVMDSIRDKYGPEGIVKRRFLHECWDSTASIQSSWRASFLSAEKYQE